jgi:hypothetical protein
MNGAQLQLSQPGIFTALDWATCHPPNLRSAPPAHRDKTAIHGAQLFWFSDPLHGCWPGRLPDVFSRIMAFRDPDAIGERLNRYADAITAFVVLECVGFVVGLANRDFYQAVLNAGRTEISTLFCIGLTFATILVFLCHVAEDKVLGKFNKVKSPVSITLGGIRTARFVIILMANTLEAVAYFTIFGVRQFSPPWRVTPVSCVFASGRGCPRSLAFGERGDRGVAP